MKRKKIIVLGFMGGMPISGVIWQHLHYIVGLQRLGYEVIYVEDTLKYPYNPISLNIAEDTSYTVQTLGRLALEHQFEGRWAYCARFKNPMECFGLSLSELRILYKEADIALNLCGSHDINDDMRFIRNLVYIETDPGVEQIKIDQEMNTQNSKTIDYLQQHHHLFTFGENIGHPSFIVPTHGFRWMPTRQPVVTDFWCNMPEAPQPDPMALFTTICNWSTRGQKDIEWRSSHYLWDKSFEFLRFIQAPKLAGECFEIVSDIQKTEEQALFRENQWKSLLPHNLSIHWNTYRQYILDSKGEFTCAKDQYIRLNTGWFSDRSACYLAAGRPVITQATGCTDYYSRDGGLFPFSTMDDILEALATIRSDYKKQSCAALAIAREIFEAEKVLASLLDRAGI